MESTVRRRVLMLKLEWMLTAEMDSVILPKIDLNTDLYIIWHLLSLALAPHHRYFLLSIK